MMAPAFPQASALAAVSARIGADPLLVQGPGGNTSCKSGDALWIKASGFRLSDAAARPIFVGLSLAQVRGLAVTADTEDFSTARLPGSDPALRPSIETALHALMPHPAVIHAHAVCSMTVSVLESGQALTATALEGLAWAWIPYCRPGAALAGAVCELLSKRNVDVLILQNHGVVVGADTPEAAEFLLREVESRLACSVRTGPMADPAQLAARQTDRYEALAPFSALALDFELFAAVTESALFPDQVVFLGGAVPAAVADETLDAAADRISATSGIFPALILSQGIGAFGARERTSAASAVIQGLFEVARRLPAGSRTQGLPREEVEALLNWEAEHYRIALASQEPD